MRVWSFSWVVTALALVFLVSQPLQAEEKGLKTHEGKVVKAGDGKLLMSDKEGGKQHMHIVPATAKITCDGKECKLEDLKEGTMIRVTTKDDTERTVTKVEAKTVK